MNKIFFTPGPSALYFTVEQHIKNALKNNIPSISHRSKEYVKMHEETVENLKTLLSVPEDYSIGFLSSATEVWERSIESLVEKESFHFVNGAFSEKFHSVSKALGKNALLKEAQPGTNNDIQKTDIPNSSELISLAQNETSTGVAMPVESIKKMRTLHPQALIAVDGVSSLPVANIDIQSLDTLYFSVQKCFGLPSGLGVWIYNQRCIDKANELKSSNLYHDTYNGLLNIDKFGKKHQTSCTPNVLNIYLLGQVAKDMLNKGLDQIRRESLYKSALIYDLFENHPSLDPFVKEKVYRSVTVGVAEVNGGSDNLMQQLSDKGLIVGGGYSQFKGKHIRIANFPTHSKEQMEMLVDTIKSMDF